MDIDIRRALDDRLDEMTDAEIEGLARAWQRREAARQREIERRNTLMGYARKELLARENATASTRAIAAARRMEEGNG